MAKREREKAIARKAARAAGPARVALRGVAMSARKARAIADLIRGVSVEAALTSLLFQRKKAANPIRRALESVVATASEKGWNIDNCVVSAIQVHKGPISRRFMPRAQGRASPIRKQSAHVDIELQQA